MSRTYRHRHTVPKGHKAVNRDDGTVIIDENGDVVWTDDHSGYHLQWRQFRMKVKWNPGYGFETNMLERWKKAWFGKQKIPVVKHCIKDFDRYGHYRTHKEWNRFRKKASRRKVKMKIQAMEFHDLPLQEGRQPLVPQCYRKPSPKHRVKYEDYLECVHSGETLPDSED